MARPSLSIYIIFIHLLFFGCCVYAQEEAFLRAHLLYQEGNYQEALNGYEAIVAKGPAIWYSMGQCALSLRQYARARLFFEHARKGASAQLYQAIDEAIITMYKQLDGQPDINDTGIGYMIRKHTNHVPLLFIQLFFLVMWYCALVLWFINKPWARGLLYVKVIILTFLGTLLYIRYHDQTQRLGIIRCPSSNLYAGPHANYHIVGTVTLPACVRIVQEHDAWYKIRTHQGQGWIAKEMVASYE